MCGCGPKGHCLLAIVVLCGAWWNSAAAQVQRPPATRLPDERAKQLRLEGDRFHAEQNFSEALRRYLEVYPNFSNDFELNVRIARIYLGRTERGEWRKAIPYLERAHQREPANLEVLHDLAAATSWAGQYDQSIPFYRELVRRSPDVPALRLQLARVLSWAGRTTEAVTEYIYYVSRRPSDLSARVELGRLLAQQKSYSGAQEQYEEVLRVQPRNVAARFGRAQILAWSAQLRPALAEVDKALEIQPRHFDARTLKAYLFAWLGEIEQSKELFLALERENPKSSDVREGLKYLAELEEAGAPAPPPPTPPGPVEPTALELAQKAVAEQRYEEAIALYREHLTKSPEDADAQLALARVLSWDRQYAASESILRDWVKEHPNNPEGVTHLARVLSWSGMLQESIEQYRRALALRPQDSGLHLELARVLSWVKDYPASLDEYRTAAHLDPENIEAQRGVIQALLWNNELMAAGKELSKLKAQYPSDPELPSLEERLEALEAQRARGASPEMAEDYFRKLVEKEPSNVDARLELVDVYLGAGDYASAIRELDTALSQRPGDDSIRLRLARVLSWNRELAKSAKLYREYVAKHPSEVQEHLQLARVLSWARDYDAAVIEYREVLKKDPNNADARLELARALTWSKQYIPALQEFESLSASSEKKVDVLVGQGRVYTYQSRWHEAVEAFDAALAVQPDSHEALVGKAQALLWSGDGAGARKILTQLHAQDPNDTTILVSLASAENSLHRPDRALDLLGQAERVAPGNADARQLRSQIQAALRPELTLSSSYLRDTDALNWWRYAIDFRFSLHPRVRNFITVEYLPSSALAGLFGYAVPTASGLLFATRVPVDPFVPSPTLLSESDFAPEVLVSGDTRFSQSAGQFLAGASMHLSRWFAWTAGAGAAQLRHGSEDFESLGFPSARTRFIYTATPTFYLGEWQLSLTSSRQYWAYTPKAVAQTTRVDELSGMLAWNPDSRSRIAFTYYHRQISPKFLIPTLTIFDPTYTTPIGTFQGREYKKAGNGGTVSATYAIGRWEKGDLTIGYEGMAFGYHHPQGLPSPEYFLNVGVFTPPFYQRHAGLVRIELRPSGAVTWDVHGSLGAQQFLQRSDLALSPTAGSRLDIAFSSHVTLTLAYEYFNSASAAQAAILRPVARSYHSNYVSAGLRFRF